MKALAPLGFWAEHGSSPAAYVGLTWRALLVENLLPVTLGNALGGAVLVGLSYWFISLRPSARA